MEEIIRKIKIWVEENYNTTATGWTARRSEGNYDDCFSDGMECGASWAAYEVGEILGMDLPEPETCDEEDY